MLLKSEYDFLAEVKSRRQAFKVALIYEGCVIEVSEIVGLYKSQILMECSDFTLAEDVCDKFGADETIFSMYGKAECKTYKTDNVIEVVPAILFEALDKLLIILILFTAYLKRIDFARHLFKHFKHAYLIFFGKACRKCKTLEFTAEAINFLQVLIC